MKKGIPHEVVSEGVATLDFEAARKAYGISRSYYFELRRGRRNGNQSIAEEEKPVETRDRLDVALEMIAEEQPNWGREKVAYELRMADIGLKPSPGTVRERWKKLGLATPEARSARSRKTPTRPIMEIAAILGRDLAKRVARPLQAADANADEEAAPPFGAVPPMDEQLSFLDTLERPAIDPRQLQLPIETSNENGTSMRERPSESNELLQLPVAFPVPAE